MWQTPARWDWKASAVNFGASDFLSGANVGDTKENGMFMNLTLGTVNSSLGGIKDGASTTLLLSENIQKASTFTWLGVSDNQCGEQQFGMDWVVNTNPTPSSPPGLTDQARISDAPGNTYPEDKPLYARPGSSHPSGSVNAFLPTVMVGPFSRRSTTSCISNYLTPNGAKCVDPTDHNANGPGTQIYKFRTAQTTRREGL